MLTFREFLPLASPLMVQAVDGPAVLLAFAILADGSLTGMVVDPHGGPAVFVAIDALDFPPPVQLRPVASAETKLS